VNVSRETVRCAACLLFGAGGRRGVFFREALEWVFAEAEDENMRCHVRKGMAAGN
jgi:hypothetical protein